MILVLWTHCRFWNDFVMNKKAHSWLAAVLSGGESIGPVHRNKTGVIIDNCTSSEHEVEILAGDPEMES
jgi:hypothetical protein